LKIPNKKGWLEITSSLSLPMTKQRHTTLFSIKASLERFNMPDLFIKYVLNIHTDITAAFKTYHGLTEKFKLENSIKQAIANA